MPTLLLLYTVGHLLPKPNPPHFKVSDHGCLLTLEIGSRLSPPSSLREYVEAKAVDPLDIYSITAKDEVLRCLRQEV